MLFNALWIFLVVLIVYMGVAVSNKIKEGRYIGRDIEQRSIITVSDSAEVQAKPDLALTSFSVVNEAKTVQEAIMLNTEKMNAVINFIKEQGVEAKDLKTTTFTIYPRYEWTKETGSYPYPEGRRVLVGYEVHQSLQVKIRDMEKIGAIIGGATRAGANQVGDLTFTIDKQEELKNQARQEAITKAKAKAEELASQLGVRLARIIDFREDGVTPRYYDYALEKAVGLGGGGEAPQIEIGENEIKVTVSISYEIN